MKNSDKIVESDIKNVLDSRGYIFIKKLKSHLGKRYTYLVKNKSKYYIVKIHLNSHIILCKRDFFNINILEMPPKIIFTKEILFDIPNVKEKILIDRFSISVFHYIDATDVETLLNENEKTTTTIHLQNILDTFISLSLTEIKPQFYGPYSYKGSLFKNWDYFIKSLLNKSITILKSNNLLTSQHILYFENFLNKETLENANNIVHYDLSPSNILINNQGDVFVIDWDGYYIGDVHYSIGKFLYYLYINQHHYFFNALLIKCYSLFDKKKLNQHLSVVLVEKISNGLNKKTKHRLFLELNLLNRIIDNAL